MGLGHGPPLPEQVGQGKRTPARLPQEGQRGLSLGNGRGRTPGSSTARECPTTHTANRCPPGGDPLALAFGSVVQRGLPDPCTGPSQPSLPAGDALAAASFSSFAQMFLHRVASTPDSEAFSFPDRDEQWQTVRWREVGERVRSWAGGLRALGVELEDRCAILSSTRYEWILADLSICCARGATTTLYASTIPDECAFILADSGCRVVFVENEEQVQRLLGVRDQIPSVERVVTFDGSSGHDGWVMTLDELEHLGQTWNMDNPGAYEDGVAALKPEHLATVLYTSGTTGQPKGVEMIHDCWVYEGEALDAVGFLTPADKQLLWLPLAHSFGKMLLAAILRIGIPTAVDGRAERVVENLATVAPTFVAAVPRIFEKAYSEILERGRAGGPARQRFFDWALSVGHAASRIHQSGEQPRGTLALQHAVADRAVFAPIRARFGGRLRFFISGSAPLDPDLAAFFHAAGVLILEGYGLTESAAATFANRPDRYAFGTVGVALPGVEVRIAPEDNEVLLKSRGVMRGYRNLPDLTAEVLSDDGWLRTGDIGDLDEQGFLRITDRKKSLIKTSSGKYVAPALVEGRLKTASPLISHAVLHGDRRNYCVALLALDPLALEAWARSEGKRYDHARLAQDPHLLTTLQGVVDTVNARLNRHERVRRFAVLDHDLSIEKGELTASQKVRRKVVEAANEATLDRLYSQASV